MAKPTERTRRRLERWRRVHRAKDRWLIHWDDLARLMLPRRLGFVTMKVEGERRTEHIFDNTAMRGARDLASAVGSMLRPEGEKWFKIGATSDKLAKSAEVQDWIHFVETKMLTEIYKPKTRFRQAVGESDLDLVVLGTAATFIGKEKDANRLKYVNISLKDIDIALNENNVPDTVFQSKRLTLRNAEKMFGRDNLSEVLKQRLTVGKEAELDNEVEFLRIIEPRPSAREDALLAKNLMYTNDWIEVESQHEVSSGGFREFPMVIPRWDTACDETYGRSPGMIALSNAETLNAMSETILISGQKAADPSVFAPNDSSFDAVNSYSGGITYYDVDTAVQMRGNPFFTLDTGFNLPITRDMQGDERMMVEAAFFKNVMNLPIQGPEMTATEVIARKEEFVRVIGSTFGRLESDYLAPMVERSFLILMRMGEFDPIPEALIDEEIKFEYKSPVKQMRDQIDAASARIWVQELTEMSQVKKDVIDIANFDEIGRHAARAMDLPPAFVNSREKVDKDRGERQQQQMAATKAMMENQQLDTMAKGAKGLKDATQALGGPETAGAAIEEVMGGGGLGALTGQGG